MTSRSCRHASAAALAAALAVQVVALAAQSTPREQAPVDVTGYWVSIVTEDWHERMVTPRHGDYASLPLSDAGKRAADAWDPAKATPADACKPFGAAAIMRVPGRVRLSWESPSVLEIQTDAGLQTRRLVFDGSAPGRWRTNARGELVWDERRSAVRTSARPRDWQGQSVARWDIAPDPAAVRTSLFFPGGVGTGPDGAGLVETGRFGSLHVETAGFRAGYLRRNGVPYSDQARVTEDYDFRTEDDGTRWFTVTTVVDDPVYLSAPFVTSTDFRKENDGSKWRPLSCSEY